MSNQGDTNYRHISERLTASLGVLVLVLESGCATLPPPNTPYEAALGRVAVVATSQEPEIKLEGFTHGKGEGALMGAGEAFGGCMKGMGAGDLLFGLLCGVVASPVGAIVGAVEAPSSGEVRTSEAAISTGLAVKTIQEKLREQVVAAALAEGTSLVTVSPESAQHAAQLRDYLSVAAAGVDTVLEVTLTKVGTEAAGSAGSGFNPPLLLSMQAHVRLIRTDDNAEVFANDYVYQGENLEMSEWSANQGERLLRDLQIGYETLGTHIYENVFLLYPFPDRKVHMTGLTGYYGLAAIYPLSFGDRAADDSLLFPSFWTMVDSLQPTLRWQGFPRATDFTSAPEEMGRIKNVRYDLVIAREHNLAPAEVVYRRGGLSDTVHTIETSLSASTRYFWTVRARFELDGRERVTEWASVGDLMGNFPDDLPASPSQLSYRFKTP